VRLEWTTGGWHQLDPWLGFKPQLPVGALFCVSNVPTAGRPWSAAAARTQFRHMADRAAVRRRFAPHQLRHAHAVEMAREGVPLNVIQRQLGHADLGITTSVIARSQEGNGLRPVKREAVSVEQESPERITLSSEAYFRVIEERRRGAEGVLWQLPSISLAAQAFLLSAGLNPKAEPSSQIIVGALGIAAVFGTGLFVLYQAVRADIFRCWVKQMVFQPLAPDELATKSLKLSDGKIRRMEWVFKAFPRVCVGALFVFLVADGFVLGRGVAGL
jgi:integrase-like protein